VFHMLWIQQHSTARHLSSKQNAVCLLQDVDVVGISLQLGQQRAEEAAAIEAKKRRIADAAASLKAVPQQLSSIESASRSWNAQPVDPAM